jgi:predicted Zn-dependent peptidase
MEITLIIVGGLTIMTIVAVVGDYFSKKKQAVSKETVLRLQALEQQVQVLEAKVADKDERIAHLEEGMGFVNRLLEDKSK